MYKIKVLKSYIKSLKKISSSGLYSKKDFDTMKEVIDTLAEGTKLHIKYKDHSLVGNKYGQRECYIKHDLLLIYKIEEDDLILILIDIGSHNHVFK